MGDTRYGPYYRRLLKSEDPAADVRKLGDVEVVAALAAASRENDALIANVLATEALNRVHRATAVAQNIAEGVLAVDASGRVTFLNAAAERMLGPRDELLGRTLVEALRIDGPDGIPIPLPERPVTLALRGEAVRTEEVHVTGPNGRTFPASYAAIPVDLGGDIVGAVITFQDVSERRLRLEQLRASEERYRRLYDDSPAMHFTVAPDGTVRSVNGEAARMLGFDPPDLTGGIFLDLVHPDDRKAALRAFEDALRGVPSGMIEIRKLRRDGSSIWVHEAARASADGVLIVCQDATRLRAAEEKLQDLLRRKGEEEARFASFVHYHPDVVYGLDHEGRFTQFNPAAERATGYSADEVLGRPFAPLVAPEDLERAKANFARILSGQVHENTYTLLRKDGTRAPLHLIGVPAVVGGRVVGSFGIAKVGAEDDPVGARFRRHIEALADPAVVLLDPAGHVMSWNRGAERLTQWRAEETRGRHVGLLYSPEAREAGGAAELLERASAQGRVVEEGWRVRKDGTAFWSVATVMPIKDDHGVLQGFILRMRAPGPQDVPDVGTETRARQQAVVAQLGVLALRGIDLRSLMDLTVKSAADTLGVDFVAVAELAADRRSLQVVAGAGWGRGVVGSLRVSAGPETLSGYTLVDGGPVVVRDCAKETRFTQHELFEEHGITSGVSVVIPGRPQEPHYGVFMVHTRARRDFTQDDVNFVQAIANVVASAIHRVRAEEDLREANRNLEARVRTRTHELSERNTELEAFSYSASHDLRAPLRGITYLSRMLREDLGPRLSASEREDLERLSNESERLTRLVNDLLALSRVGAAAIEPRRVDLTALARSVVEDILSAETRDVDVRVEEGLETYADPDLLRALLANLLGNAVKYTRTTPNAHVQVGRDSEGFYVRDNGVGFDPTRADRLFVAFHRLHGAEFEGTGIGLATVRRIVERHGGRVWAESPGVGKGATFHFTLPEEGPRADGAEPPAPAR